MSHGVTLAAARHNGVMTTDPAELQREVSRLLESAGFDDPRREAELLIAAVLDLSPGEFELRRLLGRGIEADAATRVRDAAQLRARRIPLQHLTGRAPFAGLELEVGPGVFVPRPETETLVALALERIADTPEPRVLDLCTGSGAIAIAIASARPDAEIAALEASAAAWPWLRRNLRALAPAVRPVFGDWMRGTSAYADGSVDLLVSNPPYVPAAALPADPEVREFDPAMALYSGADGLDEIRRMLAEATRVLRPGGSILLEHTEAQGAAIRALAAAAGLIDAVTHADLTGRDRITSARRVGDGAGAAPRD